MSINPRLRYADNQGWQPCLPPMLLGALLAKAQAKKPLTIIQKAVRAYNSLRDKLQPR
jgi:hypothetical protein